MKCVFWLVKYRSSIAARLQMLFVKNCCFFSWRRVILPMAPLLYYISLSAHSAGSLFFAVFTNAAAGDLPFCNSPPLILTHTGGRSSLTALPTPTLSGSIFMNSFFTPFFCSSPQLKATPPPG